VDGGLGAGGGGLDLRFDLDLGFSFERRWVRDGMVVVVCGRIGCWVCKSAVCGDGWT
jgi:hypothetical protein